VGAKFLDTIGGKLAENWAASVLTPALLFWVGGLLALTWRTGWEPLERWLAAQSALSQLFLAGGALAVFAASAVVVDALNISVLRLLEGYWPRWLGRLRRWSVRRLERRIGEREARLQVLAARRATLTAEETAELAALQQELHGVPALPVHYMPTRFGNMLRAAERRIGEKYGLEVVVCWPRLWLLLSDGARREIADARAQVDIGARFCLWGVLFVGWGAVAWWAVILGGAIAVGAYRWMLGAADVYASLLESCFDVSRAALYKALRWPLPANPAEEAPCGQALTRYLFEGSDRAEPPFVGSGL